MPRINKGLKQGLAGALALGAAAAVPTVMASSQAQQGLVPWQPGGGGGGGGGGCGGGSAATESAPPAAGGTAVAPPDWSLSRVLEQVLQQVRQLAVGGPQADEEAGSDEGEESWEDELPAADASDQASSLGPEAAVAAAAAAAAPSHAQQPQHAQQHGGRQRRRGRDFLSARRLAAEHPEDVRQLRQMTLDELTRLRAEDSSSSSSDSSSSAAATPVARRQQAQGRGGRQQAPQQLQAGEEAQQQQLPARLTDAELVRFAIMQGLLQAASPAERETKLREGAAAAARTALWLEQHPFSSDEELSRFAHLVRWEGPDAAGRPVLRILIGVAVTECRGNAALAFANAILTHMEQGVSSRLHDAPPQPEAASSSGSGSSTSPSLQFVISQPAEGHGLGQRGSGSGNGNSGGSTGGDCVVVEPPAASPEPAAAAASPPAAAHAAPMPHYSPEQVVVLMDCRGASTLNAARISWVFKAVASSLSHHYPGRLHELVLLDLPVVLSWMVKGVKQLVHPDTRGKFRVVHAGQQPAVQQAQQQHGSRPVLSSDPQCIAYSLPQLSRTSFWIDR
ncbi:Sec14 cytosolic factor [Chlorella sorokiniana]|uniref:Sec14 cytosolic factor n=1 Tax=Chlorella sorokiniana TaxID=3076 RepID=A0A2P6U2I6_CHLSO|nr:Sec14 cytosolic factor [Chlorella sorokiniana]|eukprot:PRW60524.1 Sec14 cytosolic factor [Chlorella sorokiniana]